MVRGQKASDVPQRLSTVASTNFSDSQDVNTPRRSERTMADVPGTAPLNSFRGVDTSDVVISRDFDTGDAVISRDFNSNGEEVVVEIVKRREVVQKRTTANEIYEVDDTVVTTYYPVEEIVEIPDIEVEEKFIDVVNIIEVPKERVIPVDKEIFVDKIIEREVIVETEVIKEVDQHVDEPVAFEFQHARVTPKVVEVERSSRAPHMKEVTVTHNIVEPELQRIDILNPIPVECEISVEYALPKIRENRIRKKYPVYLPRFIEVPVLGLERNRVAFAEGMTRTDAIAHMQEAMVTDGVALGALEKIASTLLKQNEIQPIKSATDNLGAEVVADFKLGNIHRYTRNAAVSRSDTSHDVNRQRLAKTRRYPHTRYSSGSIQDGLQSLREDFVSKSSRK